MSWPARGWEASTAPSSVASGNFLSWRVVGAEIYVAVVVVYLKGQMLVKRVVLMFTCRQILDELRTLFRLRGGTAHS